MYPPEFDYYRAASVEEAIAFLGENPEARLLAGGHSLLPLLKLRQTTVGALVDIGRISELKGVSRLNGSVRVGALTTHVEITSSADLPQALREAAANIGDRQVRNRGTVGGNVAHADPASDLPTVLVALGAAFRVAGPQGKRTITASDFFTGWFTTVLQEGEVLTGVFVPVRSQEMGSAYAKLPHPASGYAILGASAALSVTSGRCTSASVAVGGLTPGAIRAPSVEAALIGKLLDMPILKSAARAIVDDLGDDLVGDYHASAEYRKAIAPVYVERALRAALARVGAA